MKYVQSWQQKRQNNVNDVVVVFLLTLNIIHFFNVSIVDFKQINASWEHAMT